MPTTWTRWKKSELEFIRSNCKGLSVEQIASRLGRTPKATRTTINRLGIRLCSYKKSHVEWTSDEIKILESNRNMGINRLHKLLPRHTRSAVKGKRCATGLVRTTPPSYNSGGYHIKARRRGDEKRVIFIHREIVEQHIGRKLDSSEIVHHINYDKKDNSIENLYLCRDRGHHANIHRNCERLVARLMEKGFVWFNKTTGEYKV